MGNPDIGDEEIEVFRIPHDTERIQPILRHHDLKAGFGQNSHEDITDILVILGDQDARGSLSAGLGSRFRLGLLPGLGRF